MPPALAIAGAVLLVAVVTAALFAAVNWGIKRSIARRRAALEGEGVVRDTGVCRVRARYRRFRGRGLYMGAGVRISPGQLVLTRAHLHVLGVRGAEPVPLAELHRYRASVADGRLVITTDEPLGATGRLELRIELDDAASWVDALDDAGSRAAS